MNPPRVVVIGGGISGLSFATSLIEECRTRGVESDVRLIESGAPAGGHARTLVEDGFVVESGPNGFLDRDGEALSMIESVGLGPNVVEASASARRRFIVRDRKLVKVPDSPLSFLTSSSLSFRGKLRLMGEPFAGPPEGQVEETVYEFAARRIGPEAAETFVDTIVSGISGGDSRTLSVRSQFPLLHEWERKHGSLVKAAFAERKPGPRKRTRLLTLDRGLGALTSTLAERLGNRVSAGVPVRSVEREPSGYRVEFSDGRPPWTASHVMFATPSRVTSRLVSSSASDLSKALSGIPYGGLAVVSLAFDASRITASLDGYGYLVPRRERLATLGVLFESSIFAGRAPAGRVLLRIVLGGASRPDVLDLGEGDLVTLARRELQSVMGIDAEPLKRWVFRWPQAIAQYTVGHAGRLESGACRVRDRLPRRFLHGRDQERAIRRPRTRGLPRESGVKPRHVVLVSYGEPATPDFADQFAYSFRILQNLTRIIARIPAPLLPLIAFARARGRRRLWRARGYASPLEAITRAQAAGLKSTLEASGSGERWTAHVAYEFRSPLLETVLRGLPADEPVWVVPMYAADSAFTHALSREVVARVSDSSRRSAPMRVLPAIGAETLAALSAEHVLRQPIATSPEAASMAVVLAAHGTLLEPSKPIDTGLASTERLRQAIETRLAPRFGKVTHGWLNHTRGGRWTEPPMDQALRQLLDRGFKKILYFPYGFLADNAETELEGRLIVESLSEMEARFVPCLNESTALAAAIADQIRTASIA
jgi:oxygen-dependent protoporphyrinogen oxidase